NVTLAQDGPHLIMRVRTPVSNSNGSTPQFIARDVFTDTAQSVPILFSYADGRYDLTHGEPARHASITVPPEAALVWGSFPRSRWAVRFEAPHVVMIHKIVLYVICFVPAGIFAAVASTRLPRQRFAALIGLALAPPVLVEAAGSWMHGIAISPTDLAISGGIALATALLMR